MKSLLLTAFILISIGIKAQKTIVVIGSSTSSGYGLPIPGGGVEGDQDDNTQDLLPDSSWVNRMRHFAPNNVIDLAIFGEDCYQGMPSQTAHMPTNRPLPDANNNITKALQFNPDIVVVNFPSNNYDIYSVGEVMVCLRTIYLSATNNGHTQCFITTTQPRDIFSTSDRLKLKTIRDSILAQFGIHAIDFFTSVSIGSTFNINPIYSQGDGIHLNSLGHKQLWLQALGAGIIQISTPITLASFTATSTDNGITFNWQTGIESNMKSFTLQQSSDTGITWQTVSILPAKNIASSSYQIIIKDGVVISGISLLLLGALPYKKRKLFLTIVSIALSIACNKAVTKPSVPHKGVAREWRLKMVDNDGNTTYSQIIRI